MNHGNAAAIEDLKDLPVSPQLKSARARGYVRMPDLDDGELLGGQDLERWGAWQDWGKS